MKTSIRRPNLAATALCCALAACASHRASQDPVLGGETRLRVAQAAEQSGDIPLADSMYAEASASAPTDAAVQLGYADVLLRQGRPTEARDLLLRHIRTVADPQALQAGLAAIYVLSGDPASALAEYNKLLAVKPDDMRITVDKAVALDLLGRHEEAQALYRRALSASPDDTVVISDLALSLVLSGRAQEASALVAPLRNADNVLPRVRNDMAVVLAANGKSATVLDNTESTAIEQLGQALNRGAGKPPAHNP